MDFAHFFLAVETYLARRHAILFMEVSPGCVDDRNIVFLIAFKSYGVGCDRGRTFDRVCFCELNTINEDFWRDCVPFHSLGHTEINVGGR